jgi:TetR/AcrR family transcriptional repressor of nem operon
MNETKRHILDVSLRLFLQKNFKEVTMREIVEKSGASKGAFYHYFESKERLFQEILDDIIASMLNAYRHELRKDSLYHFYHDYIDFSAGIMERLFYPIGEEEDVDGACNFFILIFDALKIAPDSQEKVLASLQFELDSWVEIVRAARERGEIRSVIDDELIARMFVCSADGVGLQNIMKQKTGTTRADMRRLWDGFYELLKA